MAEQSIYQAINEVMEACGAVGKDAKNQQQGYKYRGIDDVMNALNPALRKAKVFASPEVLESTREERHTAKGALLIYSIAKIKYTFYAADGSSVSAIVIGEGMDSGDKSMNKAMSAAYKYALFQVFCIPTEEMVDSEVDSPEPMPKDSNGNTVIENPTAQDMARIAAEATERVGSPDEYRQRVIDAFKQQSESWQAKTLENWHTQSIEQADQRMLKNLFNYFRSKGIEV